jgi:1-acyl-sn-glycerol-3-phosphate acyltransferase
MRSGSRPLDLARSIAFYAVFYLGSVFFVVGAAASIALSERAFRWFVRGWSGFHRRCARALLGIRVRLEGAPSHSPVLYALRHESFFEAIDLPHLLGHPAIIAKAELMRIPLWGRAASHWGLISVERDQGAKALRHMVVEARKLVAQGRPLAIFPEGTRVPAGQRLPLQSGFAALYKLLALPVVPVALDSGRLYHRWIKRPGVMTYRFAEPIPPGLPREEIEARVIMSINALNAAPNS